MIRRIGVLTSGGDSPGMNAAIRAVTRVALASGIEVMGIRDGYRGLVSGNYVLLDKSHVADRLDRGGTFLGSARLPEFKDDEVQDKAVEMLQAHQIDAVVVVGGDGSYRGALALTNNKKYAYLTKIPSQFCYLTGKEYDDYLFDLCVCQEFASKSRMIIATKILNFLNINSFTHFETIHNFIEFNKLGTFIRKGAIPAYKNQKVLIPMNMRDGCIIGIGKGNEEWNYSAPHGAGRLLSRGEVKSVVDVNDFKETMKGIYTTTANEKTIDESPFAYKPMEGIINLIQPTVEIIKIIKPVYNFKAAK